ncbi:MAG: DUF2510 domain-containing protein [Actinobacteria bacterium]|nr:DUF2510 domain-containing protein [Actinomycetota bacterium]
MSQVPAGWFNDPYGRYQQRYWDGGNWTEHVITNGQQTVDPMGNSPVIPIATPSTAFEFDPVIQEPAPTAALLERLLERLGPDARERPLPGLRVAVAGLGGVVLAIGLLVAATGDDPSRGSLVGVSSALIAIAWVLRWFVTVPEVGAAAVGMVVVGIVVFSVAATVSDGSTGSLTALLMAALFVGAWAAPGFRGRNLLLGLGALSLVVSLGALAGGDGGQVVVAVPAVITDGIGRQGAVYLVGAALLFAGTWWLDRTGVRGAGTALVGAGLVASLVGAALLVTEFGDTTGPLFVSLVGLAICVVGSHGGRRATTWWGAGLLASGFVAFIAVVVEPDSSAAAGGVGIGAGVLLVVLPIVAGIVRRRGEEPPVAQ